MTKKYFIRVEQVPGRWVFLDKPGFDDRATAERYARWFKRGWAYGVEVA